MDWSLETLFPYFYTCTTQGAHGKYARINREYAEHRLYRERSSGVIAATETRPMVERLRPHNLPLSPTKFFKNYVVPYPIKIALRQTPVSIAWAFRHLY